MAVKQPAASSRPDAIDNRGGNDGGDA